MQLKFVHFVLFAKRPSSRPRFSKKSYYIVVLGENDWGISVLGGFQLPSQHFVDAQVIEIFNF